MPDSFAIRGRFAPSPTGPLHFGSLLAALGSYLCAKNRGGQWLLRMEDLDTPRNVPGAEASILACLEGFGLTWDGPVTRQSERTPLYQAALDQLLAAGLAYPCGCSRQEAAGVYPGTCRNGLPPGKTARAFRFKVNALQTCFNDELYGRLCQDLAQHVGDFVIRRADGPFAYQLAVVVDDAAQGITEVVRGADLLDSTPRQVALQQALGLPTPRYLHLPLARTPGGEKLSKQTGAAAVTPDAPTLRAALRFLGQPEAPASLGNNLKSIIEYATEYFDYKRIKTDEIPATLAPPAA
ncbi:MAG: tRNA glutamyl-Q(34) synthetase GluQRS [Betaproteobacteria bacterium]|nr:tRNA glutamyl-Q(34) synthetase GluQRS [Betaproteobacteria bacterium]MDE2131474.1 tRNA glutamyl-Q(34) synthetase GluQRS [Betaproteobacteria bacterium]